MGRPARRRATRGWRLLAALLLLAGLVLAACGGDDGGGGDAAEGDGSTSPTDGSTAASADVEPLVIAVGTEPDTLDAQAVIDRNSRVFTANVFESLLGRDRDGKIVPVLAESYESVDDSTWRFTLRQGVTFHNGEPFNAEAAAFSINRILDEKYETQRSSYINDITGAAAVDEYTLDVTTDGVDAVLPIQLTQLVMVPPVAGAAADFGEKPVGTGPYAFVEWQRGQEIVAAAYDGYWGERPTIPEFHMRVIADAQTALAALEAGEVDLVLDILPEQKDLVPKAISVPATEFSYIAFNTYKPELSDPRVRRAMNLAIDKALLADTIYLGEAEPQAAQMQNDRTLGYNPDLEMFPYDPDEAKALLAEAGYPDGFALTLNVPIGRYLKLEEAAEVVADELRDIGLDVSINLVEWNTFREQGRVPGTESGAYDLKMAWNSNEWLDASRIVSHITCEGTSSKYCDERVDTLMDDAASTLDQDARATMYEEVWSVLNESPHAIYLLQQNLIYGLSERLEWEPRLDDEYYVSEMSLTS